MNPNFAVVLPMMCHKDEATAIDRGIDGAHFFGYSLAHYYVFGEHRPGRTNVWDEFLEQPRRVRLRRADRHADDAPLAVKILQKGLGSLRGAIGTPEQVLELCRALRGVGVDQVIFVLQAGPNRHEHICEASSCSRQRDPGLPTEREQRERAKAERLAPAIEGALARRAPARRLRPAT